MADQPFDSIVLISFGGPEGPDDVIPFLENVTAGRGVPKCVGHALRVDAGQQADSRRVAKGVERARQRRSPKQRLILLRRRAAIAGAMSGGHDQGGRHWRIRGVFLRHRRDRIAQAGIEG